MTLQKIPSPVIWFTGLSGSGKTTIGKLVEQQLIKRETLTITLDGDVVRTGLCNDLGFSEKDRQENIRRVSEVAKIFSNKGFIVLCSFISPMENIRKMARSIIGEQNFIEVFVDCPLEVCERRDVKGLYEKARSGEIKEFTGISSPYQEPENPQLVLKTSTETEEESCARIMQFLGLEMLT